MNLVLILITLLGSEIKWTLNGEGDYELCGTEGERVFYVEGNGNDVNYWLSQPVLKPGKTYRVSFYVYVESDYGEGAITGPSRMVNIDIPLRSIEEGKWIKECYVIRTPDNLTDRLKFGIWHVKGRVYFDSIKVEEVIPLNVCDGEYELGEGEWIEGREYHSRPYYTWYGTNYSRNLRYFSCYFNTNRYVFSGEKEVVLLHRLKDKKFLDAEVKVQISYYRRGELWIEFSPDGKNWQKIATMKGPSTRNIPLPQKISPVDSIFIRIRSTPGSSFQVNLYEFKAGLDEVFKEISGRTVFYKKSGKIRHLLIEEINPGSLLPEKGNCLSVTLRNTGRISQKLTVRFGVEKDIQSKTVSIPPSSSKKVNFRYSVITSGDKAIHLEIFNKRHEKLLITLPFHVPPSFRGDFGYLLAEKGGITLWWCDAGYRVSEKRPPPDKRRNIELYAAGNEYDPFQLVITCDKTRTLEKIEISDLKGKGGIIQRKHVRFYLEKYVHVRIPSSLSEIPGMYPDPLIPVDSSSQLKEGNNPLYVLFYIPPDIKEGKYQGTISLKVDGQVFKIPVTLNIFSFTLPEESHLRSLFGFQPWEVRRYHHIKDPQLFKKVLRKYYLNFKEHRISPNFPMDPIEDSVDCERKRIYPDFTGFDSTAEIYLDSFKFNTFRLPLKYFSRGTFFSRRVGEICGFKMGTREYEELFSQYLRSIVKHLKEKGWLKKACVYWFDEPTPKDYEFVREGMKFLKKIAPDLKTLLTEEPVPELYGYVDIWCPLMGNFDFKTAQKRKKKGEEVWWYIAGGPPPPYPTQYIERPQFELRMWPVVSFRFGVSGILIWNTNYWTSNLAFPDSLQNPYMDPMSYQRGYGKWKGYVRYWNNGNGRLKYPPPSVFESDTPCVLGPVNSLRWEMLREGMEDYEYLWMLRKLEKDEKLPTAVRKEIDDFFREFESLISSPSEFVRDPEKWYRIKCKMGRLIEKATGK